MRSRLRRSGAALAAALLPAGALAGCGADPAAEAAATAQQRFTTALSTGDTAAACAALAPDAVEHLRAAHGRDCARELRGARVGGGPVREVQVWGTQAQVRTTGDTVFLTRGPDGWRVIAAGCRSRGELPYACAVGASG